MKVIKIIAALAVLYVAVVVGFETWLGITQPAGRHTLSITTTDAKGERHERVLSRLDNNGKLYVSANHWPRAWYAQALRHPNVDITIDGVIKPYVAVPVTGAEHERMQNEHRHKLSFRILTGFPPRYFLRLDPQ